MTPEKLDQMERCYRQWNGSAVMEGAFKELLGEAKLYAARVTRAKRAIGNKQPMTALAALDGYYDQDS